MLPVEAGARRAASEVKRRLSEDAGGGSDHLALVSVPASTSFSNGLRMVTRACTQFKEHRYTLLWSVRARQAAVPCMKRSACTAAGERIQQLGLGQGQQRHRPGARLLRAELPVAGGHEHAGGHAGPAAERAAQPRAHSQPARGLRERRGRGARQICAGGCSQGIARWRPSANAGGEIMEHDCRAFLLAYLHIAALSG